jgi:hypothetical protein
MLIVAEGAPGLTKAIEQYWPASDRQRCCVHRARNLYAKLPDRRETQPLTGPDRAPALRRRLCAFELDADRGHEE